MVRDAPAPVETRQLLGKGWDKEEATAEILRVQRVGQLV